MTEFAVTEVTVCKVISFLNEALRQIDFLGIYEMLNITDSSNLDC